MLLALVQDYPQLLHPEQALGKNQPSLGRHPAEQLREV